MKVITIGRSKENDIAVNDPMVSRTHLQIVQDDSGVCSVVDLNSSNGTYVNGQRISGEVKLQPKDEICIGNTILPWQEYIKVSIGPVPPPKSNKVWLYVVTGFVFVLLAGGIGLYVYHDGKMSKEQEKREQERAAHAKRMRQESEQTKRLQDKEEAIDLYIQALKSDRDKRIESANKDVAKANQRADQAFDKAQKTKQAAEESVNKANKRADQAVGEANKEKQKAKDSVKKANERVVQAVKEKDEMAKTLRLTTEFYDEYNAMKQDFARQVCDYLKKELHEDRNDAKKFLKDWFNASANEDKQAILRAIQVVKQQRNKSEKTEEVDSKPAISDSTQDGSGKE